MSIFLKKLFIIIFCLLVQINCYTYAEDITENHEYQNVMKNIRQRYAEGQIKELEPDSVPLNIDVSAKYLDQDPNDIETKSESMISLYPNAGIPLVATIRDKDEVITPKETDIFMLENILPNTASEQNNNQYSGDFEEGNEIVPSSQNIITDIPQDNYNNKSENDFCSWIVLAVIALYFIIGWKLDFNKVSSNDSAENDDVNEQKTVNQTQTYHNTDSQEELDKSDKLSVIKSAIQNGYKLKILYKNKDKYNNKLQETIRIISPKNLKSGKEINNKFIRQSKNISTDNLLYLSAYCHLKQAERLFRLDRLEILEVIKIQHKM